MFYIYRKRVQGITVNSLSIITDKQLFDFLIYICMEKVASFIISNARLSDSGISILFEYLQDQFSLNSIKIYNNIMEIVGDK